MCYKDDRTANRGRIGNVTCVLHILTSRHRIYGNIFNFIFITLWMVVADFIEYSKFLLLLYWE